jgi:SWI/SNF-related matrix-associated actin-dependent regulator 1 of chromatin subfamily A
VGGLRPDRPSAPRLVLRNGIAAVDAVDDPALAGALAAIPGNVIAVRGMAWATRVGPERACSLLIVAQQFGLRCDAESRAALAAMAARRDPARPVVELIERGEQWLSLLDEPSLGVETLRAVPGSVAQEGAGRLEVPLTRWTAPTIAACIEAHALRPSPPAELALREALEAPAPSPAQDPLRALPDGDAHHVAMLESASHVILTAAGRDDLARAFAGLPEARSTDRDPRRWMVPASPEAARALRETLRAHEAVTVDATATRWLADAPRWIARADIDQSGDEPLITVTTRWGEPPAALRELERRTVFGARLTAALSIVNLRLIGTLRETEHELTLDAGTERAITWIAAHPGEPAVPGAELGVVTDGGPARFVIEPVWNPDIEAAFFSLEAHLLRIRRMESPEISILAADAWPPDELARFVRVHRARCTPAAAARLEHAITEESDEQRLIALSRGTDAELVVEGLAVIVCPASLKLNWLREAKRWLPQHPACEVAGRGGQSLDNVDIVVVNYEVVGSHADALDALAPRALILDEAHYVKSPTAVRTRAVIDLAERLGPTALRLALTGTPIVNRPAELAPQLRVLGRLEEYGSARSFERAYTSGNARRQLHERLRASCYLRRRKADVLGQLPDKRRAVVTVPLENEPEYRRAERDFIRWLRAQVQEGKGKLPDSARGMALVRLTALRRLAARGKLRAALSWIEDFSASEERLVVFAHHREIQDAVTERFPECARIVGGDSMQEREANVRRFQADEGLTLCVASLEVASHGFTLTAAANVAFLELAWTPAKHDQAEDRVHRIGQDRAVTAWYLLASGTIDERIAALLEEKRTVVDSLTDGGEAVSSTLLSSLLSDYAE